MDTNENNQQNGPEPAGNSATPKRPFDSVISAMRIGAEDARKAAEEAIPKIKSAASSAAYWTAYGVSYAAVFQWTLAKGLTPESVKSGLRDGVTAAEKTAEEWVESFRRGRASQAAPPLTGLPPQDTRPGVA